MSPDAVTPAESGGVQDFIVERQPGVLERAIASLAECPDDELVATTHRLSGTLGTYQLPLESRAVRDLYDYVRVEGPMGCEELRAQAQAVLEQALQERAARSGGPAT